MTKTLTLIDSGGTDHTREYIHSLSDAFERAGLRRIDAITLPWPLRHLYRLANTTGLARSYLNAGTTAYITPWAWPDDGAPFPFSFWSEVVPYIFDCWPEHYDRWVRSLRRQRVRVLFVSARASADYLQIQLPQCDVHWLPEATNSDDWDPTRSLANREIDVLELGRTYPRYHDQITGALGSDVEHLYSGGHSGSVLFPGHHNLRAGLANSKIQICFPKSTTHPEGMGKQIRGGARGVETVTQRYFEAMASGSVVVGKAPAELIDLFGFNPVVTADLRDPAGQLRVLLAEIDDLQPMVTRNLERLREVGTWDSRVKEMLGILRARGYHSN